MPCYDPDSYGCRRSVGSDHEFTKLRKKLDRVTDLLCWLCQHSDPSALEGNHPLHEWWTKHQVDDAKRIAREEEEARKKEMQRLLLHAGTLSPEELKRKLES